MPIRFRDTDVTVWARPLGAGAWSVPSFGESSVAVGGFDLADHDAVALIPALDLAFRLAVPREPGELGDGLLIAEVINGVDHSGLCGVPGLGLHEAGQTARVFVDLPVEVVEVVVVGAGFEDELAADHGFSWVPSSEVCFAVAGFVRRPPGVRSDRSPLWVWSATWVSAFLTRCRPMGSRPSTGRGRLGWLTSPSPSAIADTTR